MKRILILHSNMELGGAETSLLGLLQSIDYSRYSVDLMLLEQKGELFALLPKEVNLLSPPDAYQCMTLPIADVLMKKHRIDIMCARLIGRIFGRKSSTPTYTIKQIAYKLALPFLPHIPGEYDMAISFIDPHYIVSNKVNAKVTLGWLHTDFSRIKPDFKRDYKMWDSLDYIVHISDSCKDKFDAVYPDLVHKSIVIENVLSKSFIQNRAEEPVTENEMLSDSVKLLSIGRFSHQKNFDNVPDICRRIIEEGIDVKWFLIGYGGDEELIRSKIKEAGMENHVIILGKKSNPYPYIKACDVYVQPSRYEGKCVAVREAQILGKPVIITNYATAQSQLKDGFDGTIVPLDNEGCAQAIGEILKTHDKLKFLAENCAKTDYSNSQELEKIYNLM